MLQWSQPGGGGLTSTSFILSDSVVKIKSNVFPDRGNVASWIHWVSPSISNKSINFESDEEMGFTGSGDQVMVGRFRSPMIMTSLPVHT